MIEFVSEYWLEAAFGLITAAIGLLAKSIRKEHKANMAIRGGVKALLKNQLISRYNEYYRKGYCPIWVRDDIDDMYSEYHALGGNGTITELIEKLRGLPTEPQKRKKPAAKPTEK